MISIKEVAKAAGVSVTTVSYVINGKGNISPETRQRVMETIERLGYTPSVQGRSLRDSQARIVGYAWREPLTPREGNPVLDTFLHEVIRRLEATGRHILLFNDPKETEIEVYRDLIHSRRVDGFILANTERHDQRVQFLHQAEFPFVAFGRSASRLDGITHWVDVDGAYGIRQATEHLIEQGHTRIGILAWPEYSVAGDARYRGYLEALRLHQITPDPELLVRCENYVPDGYAATREIMRRAQPPTALVSMSDTMAIGALRYLAESGQRVAVTGFDDIPAAEYVSPPLTSVHQPLSEVAELLVEMLVRQLEGEAVPEKHHLLRPELVVRASSTP